MNHEIAVMSRREAIRFCEENHAGPAVMISISDPNMLYRSYPFCTPENGIVEILPLSFADADRPGPDVYGRKAITDDLITDEDAEKIADLLHRHPCLSVIVHCDAGISRSSGVAAALMKYCNGDDSPIFENPYYHPNTLCFRKTMTVLWEHMEEAEDCDPRITMRQL